MDIPFSESRIWKTSLALILQGVLAVPLLAADKTWVSTSNQNWNNNANWSLSGAPGPDDSIVGATSTVQLNLNGANRTVTDFRYNSSSNWLVVGDDAPGYSLIVTGTLEKSGSGTWEFQSASVSATQTLAVSAANIRMNGGTLNLGGAANGKELTALSVSGATEITGGVLRVATSTAGTLNYTLGSVTMTSGTLVLNGKTATSTAATTGTVSGLSGLGGGTILASDTSNLGVATLAIQSAGTTTTDAVLGNGLSLLNVVKTGSGTQTLTGASTYSGTTTISAGTLVAGNVTALGTSVISVNGTGTLETSVANLNARNLSLGGSGAIDLRGAATGTITLAAGQDFVMTSGTVEFSYQGGTFDQILGTGAFLLSGGTIDLTNSAWDYSQTYSLFSGFGSGSVAGIVITGYDTANYQAVLDNTGELRFAAIPEPSGGLLSILGLTSLLCRRWRRS